MNKRLKRLGRRLADYWQPISISVGGLLAIAILYVFRLGSLARGVDPNEQQWHNHAFSGSESFIDSFRSAGFLAYSIGNHALQLQPFRGAGSLRFVSVLFAVALIVSFYYIVRNWYTPRIAILASALLATSSWLLHLGRYASPEISLTLPLVAAAAWMWLGRARAAWYVLPLCALIGLATMYVPGVILLLLPLVLWQAAPARRLLRAIPLGSKALVGAFAVLACLPLVTTAFWPPDTVSSVHNLLTTLGLPTTLPSLATLADNAASVPIRLALHNGDYLHLGIADIALLDFATLSLFALGVFVSIRDRKLERSRLLLYMLIGGWLLVTISGQQYISVLLPFIYLAVAVGLAHLLIIWTTVFPRNPLARISGVSLLCVLVAMIMSYNLITYFVAWPHNDAVADRFHHKLIN